MVIGILIGIPGMTGGGNTTPPSGPSGDAFLREDGSYLLREDGTFMLRE